jgi:hypothetical protein
LFCLAPPTPVSSTPPPVDATAVPWIETVALEAISDTSTDASFRFGGKLAMSSDGTTLAVYSNSNNDADLLESPSFPEITVFYKSSTNTQEPASWAQRGSKIVGPVNIGGTQPLALSSDGSTLVIGGTYTVYDELVVVAEMIDMVHIFRFNETDWELHSTLQVEALTNTSDVSISISEDASILAFGVPSIGMASVYAWNADDSDWVQRGETFRTELVDEGLGVDVALSADGSTLAIASRGSNEVAAVGGGAFYDCKINPSYANTYKWISDPANNKWTFLGSVVYGSSTSAVRDDYTIKSVSLSSDGAVLAIEIPGGTPSDPTRGRLRVYEQQEGTGDWTQRGLHFVSAKQAEGFEVASALSSDGTILALAFPGIGRVQTFKWKTNRRRWIPFGDDLEDLSAHAVFGESLALSTLTDGTLLLAVGAPMNNTVLSQQLVDTGTVRLYQRSIL